MFAGKVEDPALIDKSLLITTFGADEFDDNVKCEPEMEVLKPIVKNSEEKTTKFPAFSELLPTIGEEDEIIQGQEKKDSNETLFKTISPVERNEDDIQLQSIEIRQSNQGKS